MKEGIIGIGLNEIDLDLMEEDAVKMLLEKVRGLCKGKEKRRGRKRGKARKVEE